MGREKKKGERRDVPILILKTTVFIPPSTKVVFVLINHRYRHTFDQSRTTELVDETIRLEQFVSVGQYNKTLLYNYSKIRFRNMSRIIMQICRRIELLQVHDKPRLQLTRTNFIYIHDTSRLFYNSSNYNNYLYHS